jgi:hypothetical protein
MELMAFKIILTHKKSYPWYSFYFIWINRLIIASIAFFFKKIWIYEKTSYLWRKYILKQKI